jgi:hypothetical protein
MMTQPSESSERHLLVSANGLVRLLLADVHPSVPCSCVSTHSKQRPWIYPRPLHVGLSSKLDHRPAPPAHGHRPGSIVKHGQFRLAGPSKASLCMCHAIPADYITCSCCSKNAQSRVSTSSLLRSISLFPPNLNPVECIVCCGSTLACSFRFPASSALVFPLSKWFSVAVVWARTTLKRAISKGTMLTTMPQGRLQTVSPGPLDAPSFKLTSCSIKSLQYRDPVRHLYLTALDYRCV